MLAGSGACTGGGGGDNGGGDTRGGDPVMDDGAGGPPSFFAGGVPALPAAAFDLGAIKAASLETLGFVTTSDTTVDGVRMLDGTFSPGTYVGPVADGSHVETIVMKSRARVFFPAAATGALPILVHAAHLDTLVPTLEVAHRELVTGLGIAVVVHGELSDDWVTLGYAPTADGRGHLTNDGLAWLVYHNACALTDLLTGNYGYALAKTNMLALSLGARVLESVGNSAGGAALYGASKEGFATWICAAVDDRLIVAAPGRFHRQDLEGLAMLAKNSGCGPNGASATVDVPATLTALDWFANSAAGRTAARLMVVADFAVDLKPEALVINSDLGMWWQHDGIFFTAGDDTHFLDSFAAKPFRHERYFETTQGSPEPGQAAELGKLGHLLSTGSPAVALAAWPTIEAATATDTGAAISFSVRVKSDPDVTHVRIYGTYSPDRELNDSDQATWTALELAPETAGSRTWVGQAAAVPPAGNEIAWYAEVEETIAAGGRSFPRRHVTPIRFLRERPALSCPACAGQAQPPACFVPIVCP